MKETWKPVVGFEDSYSVSSLGRVKSEDRIIRTGPDNTPKRIQGKVLRQFKTKGYMCVNLCKEGSCYKRSVARLVYTSFLCDDIGDDVIEHVDGDLTNNYYKNLVTYSHSECSRMYGHGPRMRKVECLTTGESFPSINSASNHFGIDRETILKSCRTGNPTSSGLVFHEVQ